MAEPTCRVFTASVFFLTWLLGSLSNGLVIIAFCKNTAKQKSLPALDMVILNKASVNLLLCLSRDLPSVLHCFINDLLSEVTCRFYIYAFEALRLVSLQSLILLSFLHYIKVQRPNYRCFNFLLSHLSKSASIILGVLWVVGILMHLPYLGYKVHIARGDGMNCTATSHVKFANCIFAFDENTGSIALRFSIMVVDLCSMGKLVLLSGGIVRLLWRHRWKLVPLPQNWPKAKTWNKRTVQATKVILSFLFLYLFCWTVAYIMWFIVVYKNLSDSLMQQVAFAMPSVYYSTSSFALMLGYKKVRDQLKCQMFDCKFSIHIPISTISYKSRNV